MLRILRLVTDQIINSDLGKPISPENQGLRKRGCVSNGTDGYYIIISQKLRPIENQKQKSV